MKTNILVTAAALSDQDLLARLELLASRERETSVELVAHLAALDGRPALYAAQGHGSLFTYCTQALRLSEDAACNRIAAARACRRFPLILDLLASGSLTLTSVRLLGRHLTAENHPSVLAKARDRSRHEIEALVAELAPRPDLPSAVRKLPCPKATPAPLAGPGPAMRQVTPDPQVKTSLPSVEGCAVAPLPSALPATPPPMVQAWAPERYRVQFTIGPETHEKLRRLQALLRREIPDGDPGVIFDRALSCCSRRSRRRSWGRPPGRGQARPSVPGRIKSTDPPCPPAMCHGRSNARSGGWGRDAGQCAFVAPTGRRCTERTFLEFHHIQPYAMQGPATVANISLRCWRHNQYEAHLVFGDTGPSIVREGCASP